MLSTFKLESPTVQEVGNRGCFGSEVGFPLSDRRLGPIDRETSRAPIARICDDTSSTLSSRTTCSIQKSSNAGARCPNGFVVSSFSFVSAPGRSRTRNLTGRNRLLYPVELQGRPPSVPTTFIASREWLSPVAGCNVCPTRLASQCSARWHGENRGVRHDVDRERRWLQSTD